MLALVRLTLGVTEAGLITAMRKESGGSLFPDSILEMMDVSRAVCFRCVWYTL